MQKKVCLNMIIHTQKKLISLFSMILSDSFGKDTFPLVFFRFRMFHQNMVDNEIIAEIIPRLNLRDPQA